MAENANSNLLFARLTRGAKGPSLRAVLWGTLGLGLLSLTVGVWVFLEASIPLPSGAGWDTDPALWAFSQASVTGIPLVVLVLAWALANVMPLIVAAKAATLTSRDIQGEQDEQLEEIELSGKTFASSCVFATLYRLRLPLALIVGLMPVLVLWGAHKILSWLIYFNSLCLNGCWWPLFFPSPDLDQVGWLMLLLFLSMSMGKWMMNLLAAGLGVTLALWWHQTTPTAIAASLVLLVLVGGLNYLSVGSILDLLAVSTEMAEALAVGARWIAFYALLPLVLGWMAVRLAQRLGARTTESLG